MFKDANYIRFISLSVIFFLFNILKSNAQLKELIYPEEVYFKSVEQITFGGDNAEAYWNFNDFLRFYRLSEVVGGKRD